MAKPFETHLEGVGNGVAGGNSCGNDEQREGFCVSHRDKVKLNVGGVVPDVK